MLENEIPWFERCLRMKHAYPIVEYYHRNVGYAFSSIFCPLKEIGNGIYSLWWCVFIEVPHLDWSLVEFLPIYGLDFNILVCWIFSDSVSFPLITKILWLNTLFINQWHKSTFWCHLKVPDLHTRSWFIKC